MDPSLFHCEILDRLCFLGDGFLGKALLFFLDVAPVLFELTFFASRALPASPPAAHHLAIVATWTSGLALVVQIFLPGYFLTTVRALEVFFLWRPLLRIDHSFQCLHFLSVVCRSFSLLYRVALGCYRSKPRWRMLSFDVVGVSASRLLLAYRMAR